jgi:hypothetical protein
VQEQKTAPARTEGSGHGGWNREEGDGKGTVREREREREREEARESGREESGQVEDNWISIVFFFSPPVVSIFLFLGLVLFLLIPSLF